MKGIHSTIALIKKTTLRIGRPCSIIWTIFKPFPTLNAERMTTIQNAIYSPVQANTANLGQRRQYWQRLCLYLTKSPFCHFLYTFESRIWCPAEIALWPTWLNEEFHQILFKQNKSKILMHKKESAVLLEVKETSISMHRFVTIYRLYSGRKSFMNLTFLKYKIDINLNIFSRITERMVTCNII